MAMKGAVVLSAILLIDRHGQLYTKRVNLRRRLLANSFVRPIIM